MLSVNGSSFHDAHGTWLFAIAVAIPDLGYAPLQAVVHLVQPERLRHVRLNTLVPGDVVETEPDLASAGVAREPGCRLVGHGEHQPGGRLAHRVVLGLEVHRGRVRVRRRPQRERHRSVAGHRARGERERRVLAEHVLRLRPDRRTERRPAIPGDRRLGPARRHGRHIDKLRTGSVTLVIEQHRRTGHHVTGDQPGHRERDQTLPTSTSIIIHQTAGAVGSPGRGGRCRLRHIRIRRRGERQAGGGITRHSPGR